MENISGKFSRNIAEMLVLMLCFLCVNAIIVKESEESLELEDILQVKRYIPTDSSTKENNENLEYQPEFSHIESALQDESFYLVNQDSLSRSKRETKNDTVVGSGETVCFDNNGGCEQICDVGSDGSANCTCNEGYFLEANSINCTDINECDTNKGGCDTNCNNTDGSFICSCNTGFNLNSDNKTCSDINECDTNNGGCDTNCNNVDGSYSCSCNPGYQLGSDDKTCSDINECDTSNGGCDTNCNNTDGSFSCSCNTGYQLGSDDKTCSDINECDTNKGGCDTNCNNTVGSFFCSCNTGFNLNSDNKTCSPPTSAARTTMAMYQVSESATQLRGDDVVSQPIENDVGVPFVSSRHSEIFVGSNGIVSFDEPYNSISQGNNVRQNFISPYWTDIDQRRRGSISYEVFQRSNNGNSQLELFSRHIKQYRNVKGFEATWTLLVTYDHVGRFAGLDDESITFQVAIVTNGFDTYSIYLYSNMDWFSRRGRIFIGRNENRRFRHILYSGRPASFNIDQYVGNTEVYGFWIFKIGSAPSASQLCVNWFLRNDIFSVTRRIYSLPMCPCTLRGAVLDRRWRLSRFESFSLCFSLRTSYPEGKECCYSGFGGFISFGPRAGSSFRFNPRFFRRAHYLEDTLGRRVCCEQSNRFCGLFRSLRPAGFCRFRPRRRFAWFFGDPHINTLDEHVYVFNGLGEYTLIQASSNFTLQGRTGRAETANGTVSNATVFTALAFKDDANANFQVELNRNKTGFLITGQNRDLTLDFYGKEDYEENFDNGVLSVSRNGSSVEAVFSSGLTLVVTLGVKLLSLSVSVPDEFQNITSGLMGNYNGVKDDEYMLPNGTILSPNSTEREIFRDFGQKWLINPSETAFTYPSRKSAVDFSHPDFVPIFLDEQPEEIRNKAFTVCGGQDNIACIYDFVATGDETVALETRSSNENAETINAENANSVPEINGTQIINATIGQNTTIEIVGSDAEDGSDVTYVVQDKPESNFNFNNESRQAVWTPVDKKPVNISFYVVDTKNIQSPLLEVQIRLCDGCSGHGDCDHSRTIQDPDEPYDPSFQLVACNCHTGWTGVNCSEDLDGCAVSPCLTGQNCTDRPASNHSITNVSHDCSACPEGFFLHPTLNKCEDIDECNATNPCQQTCNNSIGSFSCSCRNGFRLSGDTSCNDINECDEKSSGCEQLCVNSDGGFTCSCRPGFLLASDGKNCSIDTNFTCPENNCTQLCVLDGNQDLTCSCKSGYLLQSDNFTCSDIDECSANPTPCSQVCTNTDGSFDCSCRAGYRLSADFRSCEVCPEFTYGDKCSKTCQCGEHGTECDNVRGCICESGWKGENCTTDIDECADLTHNCSTDTICENTDGGFECACQPGYTKTNDVCTDINECDDLALNDCEDLCQNTNGSFSCLCRDGYKINGTNAKTCIDVDECSAQSSGCEQFCDNVVGSYNCRCEFGFELGDDRKSCQKVEDVCAKVSSLNCSYACNISTDEQTANCYCQSGYQLANDKQTCTDIDECQAQTSSPCSHECKNKDGGYTCSCPIGKKLENDQRTCVDCDDNHWGENCVNECNCGIGSSRCDKITGCKCKSGWSGTRCDQDIDECSTAGICPSSSVCRNTPGNYTCTCNAGYKLEGDTCVDIDECEDDELNNCGYVCNNTVGSYVCSCYPGFVLVENKCQDINECDTGKHNCAQLCRNQEGSFVCECRYGFNLVDNNKCDADPTIQCNRTDCVQNCQRTENGSEQCFCNRGFQLSGDTNCTDIDECAQNPCQNGTCSQTDPGNFQCRCDNGYKLNTDQVSCTACTPGTFGPECNGTCDCENINTESCSTTDGKCTCRSGWNGSRCDEDIDECKLPSPPNCTLHSTCVNTNGSYVCSCYSGYFSSEGACFDINECDSDNNGCAHKCNNYDGSYNCSCNLGYQLDNNGKNCSDINECDTNNGGCDTKCNNTDGSFSCSCNTGYQLGSDDKTCSDINECDTNKGGCDTNCNNTDGSFFCSCNTGFNLNSDNKTCSDINECDTTNGGCDTKCNNTDGSFSCSCNTGYQLGSDDKTCSDINECDTNKGGCDTNCNNTDGSFFCSCNTGFNLNSDNKTCSDINECDTTNGGCDTKCNNNDGSYSCSCNPGYQLGSDGKTCSDINECDTNKGGCDTNCNNTAGSFSCSCNTGFNLNSDNKTCNRLLSTEMTLTIVTGDRQTDIANNNTTQEYEELKNEYRESLLDYYRSFVLNIIDIIIDDLRPGSVIVDYRIIREELKTASNSQSDISLAIANLVQNKTIKINGTVYNVSNAKVGDKSVFELGLCEIFESLSGNCSAGSACVNDGGSPKCKDINECENGNGGCQHTCTDFIGSYNCSCGDGYDLDSDKKSCIGETTDYGLLIGLGVGIPFCFFAILVIAAIVYIRVKSKKHYAKENLVAGGLHGHPFTSAIAKRSSHSAANYMPYSPDGLSVASSSDSGNKHKKRKGRNDFRDSAWYDNQGQNYGLEDEQPFGSNFSWDFLYKSMGDDSKFEIRRPKVSYEKKNDV